MTKLLTSPLSHDRRAIRRCGECWRDELPCDSCFWHPSDFDGQSPFFRLVDDDQGWSLVVGCRGQLWITRTP